MKKQVLGMLPLFAICASSYAMAETTETEVEFKAEITPQHRIERFCTVVANQKNTLTAVKNGPDAFKHLFGTGEHGSTKATVTVKSGGVGVPVHISVTEPELFKNGEKYVDATVSTGFDSFNGSVVKRKTLTAKKIGKQEPFKVWFYAQHKDTARGNTFGEGTYRAESTITCQPGTAEDAAASAPGT